MSETEKKIIYNLNERFALASVEIFYQRQISTFDRQKIHMNSSMMDICVFGVQVNQKPIVKLICAFPNSHTSNMEPLNFVFILTNKQAEIHIFITVDDGNYYYY